MSPSARSAFLACLTLTGLAATAHAAPDFFAPRAGMDADTALVLAAASGRADAVRRLRARLDRRPAPDNAYDGWSFLCGFDFHGAQYGRAITDCGRAIALDPAQGDADTLARAALLADQTAPRARGAAHVPVTPGVHVPVTAGAYAGLAMADTGAQICVMMQSVARSAGVKILGASGAVGSTTAQVMGQIGIIPEVRIGGAVLTDLPVLVLPDEKLTFSAGPETVSLPFILSVYALAAFGRIAWLDHDRFLALGSEAPASLPGAVPMFWHPNGLGVPLEGAPGRRAAQLDTGANLSFLYNNGEALLSAADRAGIIKATRTVGGVGAVVQQEVRRVPQASLRIAGQPLTLKNLDLTADTSTGEAARLGEDVLAAYSAVVLDFRTMTFSVSP